MREKKNGERDAVYDKAGNRLENFIDDLRFDAGRN